MKDNHASTAKQYMKKTNQEVRDCTGIQEKKKILNPKRKGLPRIFNRG